MTSSSYTFPAFGSLKDAPVTHDEGETLARDFIDMRKLATLEGSPVNLDMSTRRWTREGFQAFMNTANQYDVEHLKIPVRVLFTLFPGVHSLEITKNQETVAVFTPEEESKNEDEVDQEKENGNELSSINIIDGGFEVDPYLDEDFAETQQI